jgi:hypothetical protein
VVTFALTSQVMMVAEWTPEALEQRQERLVGMLGSLWRL